MRFCCCSSSSSCLVACLLAFLKHLPPRGVVCSFFNYILLPCTGWLPFKIYCVVHSFRFGYVAAITTKYWPAASKAQMQKCMNKMIKWLVCEAHARQLCWHMQKERKRKDVRQCTLLRFTATFWLISFHCESTINLYS